MLGADCALRQGPGQQQTRAGREVLRSMYVDPLGQRPRGPATEPQFAECTQPIGQATSDTARALACCGRGGSSAIRRAASKQRRGIGSALDLMPARVGARAMQRERRARAPLRTATRNVGHALREPWSMRSFRYPSRSASASPSAASSICAQRVAAASRARETARTTALAHPAARSISQLSFTSLLHDSSLCAARVRFVTCASRAACNPCTTECIVERARRNAGSCAREQTP